MLRPVVRGESGLRWRLRIHRQPPPPAGTPLPVCSPGQPTPVQPQFFEKKFVAFSGIGRPKKFFDTLDKIGLDIIETFAFDDHHPYSSEDLVKLSTYANRHGAELITTSKDRRRINANINVAINELPICIKWQKTSELDKFLDYLEGFYVDTKT